MKDYRQFISLVGGNLRNIRNEMFVLYKVGFHRVHAVNSVNFTVDTQHHLCPHATLHVCVDKSEQTIDGMSMHKPSISLSRMLLFICHLKPPLPALESVAAAGLPPAFSPLLIAASAPRLLTGRICCLCQSAPVAVASLPLVSFFLASFLISLQLVCFVHSRVQLM